jgi:hypothetical protein
MEELNLFPIGATDFFGLQIFQNQVHGEIKRRLNLENAYYHAVHNFCPLLSYLRT